LPKVQMPNRNGFIEDPRPDVRSPAGDDTHGGERCLAERCG
jgi:hypothetical protein